jgi:hypothetical protein
MKITPKTPVASFFFRGLITGRSFFFVTSLAAPHRVLRLLQIRGDGTPAPMILRMFGVRNGALALGLSRLHHFRAPRRFVAINVICDVIDALAFVDAGRRKEISRTGATVTTAIAASAVVAGAITYAGIPSGSTGDFGGALPVTDGSAAAAARDRGDRRRSRRNR